MNDMNQNDQNVLLSVNNVEVVYNQVILAFRGVSLEVRKGAIVSLLGANGAGKTTTLKACSNLLQAERGMITKGSIWVDGRDTSHFQPKEALNNSIHRVRGRKTKSGVFVFLTVKIFPWQCPSEQGPSGSTLEWVLSEGPCSAH